MQRRVAMATKCCSSQAVLPCTSRLYPRTNGAALGLNWSHTLTWHLLCGCKMLGNFICSLLRSRGQLIFKLLSGLSCPYGWEMASNPTHHTAITGAGSEGRSLALCLMVHGTHESVIPTQNHTADCSTHNTQL